jgi:NADPH:quinone reductase
MRTQTVQLTRQGGPEALRFTPIDLGPPGRGEVLVRHTAVGVNYIDIYQRNGAYPLPLPSGLGHEAAGVVEAVGPGVADLKPGDRVVYPSAGLGAYAEARIVPADRLVTLPASLSETDAAAVIFKGLTAWYLVHRTKPVGPGDIVVVHSAAGGVGLILASWAKALGAKVVGTVGSETKVAIAKRAGCNAVLVRGRAPLPEFVAAVSGGDKASVVYDAIGRDTFDESLDALAPFGLMVSYGAASGPVPPFDLGVLGRKGSLFLTRPSVFAHIARRDDLVEGAGAVFQAVSSGIIRPVIGGSFPLLDVAEAHRLMESGTSTGAIVLTGRSEA